MSLSDFFTGGAIRGTQFDVDTWMHLSLERRLDQLIDLVIPWHLEFLASWQRAEKDNRIPILWITYEDAMADKHAAIHKILSFYSLTVSDTKIDAAIESVSPPPTSKIVETKVLLGVEKPV